MTEEVRHEIIQRRQSGMSMRAIADGLGISRGAVARGGSVCRRKRDGRAAPSPRPRPRQSIIDPFEPILKELLAKYPNLTTERALQELQARGFTGKYTVVRQRIGLLRPRTPRAPVPLALRPGQACERRWITASTISTSRVKGGVARVPLQLSVELLARRQYSCTSSSRWTCRRRCSEHVHAFHHPGRRCACLPLR